MITDIKLTKNRKRLNVYIDGELALSIDRKTAIDNGLKKGIILDEKRINYLKNLDAFQRCMDAALNFLSYRPRSEMEIRQRLTRRGFEIYIVNHVLKQLKEQSLINDKEFGKYWIYNRNSFNPKSKTLLKVELKQKGVNKEIVNELIVDVNDEENAYNVAMKKAHALERLEYDDFRTKLFNYLKLRGFGYEVIYRVCVRIWQEKHGED